jgi:hypothetical protein
MCSKTRSLFQKRDTALHGALHAVLHAALHAFSMSFSLFNLFFDLSTQKTTRAACSVMLRLCTATLRCTACQKRKSLQQTARCTSKLHIQNASVIDL